MGIPEVAYEHHLKVPVCKRKDFLVRLEEHLNGTFIHCDVFNYNKVVRNELLEVWKVISWLHGGPIYALHDVSDLKHKKFLNLFGFTQLLRLSEDQEIWIWSKHNG